nr:hypothetical protein [Tanacetum cinerariifolium]
MLLCKQEEAGIQLNAEQADWKDDTDDESDDQELEARYMYMAKLQQVSPDAVDSGPILDTEPEQKLIEIVLFIKPKRAKDAAYHREKMLLCKQEEAGIQLNAEQADWKDDTDDESDDQELEAHYMYMAKVQEVSPDAVDPGPIFDTEPEKKVHNDDYYDVFSIECQHSEQSKSVHKTYFTEQYVQNVPIESVDMSYDSEQIDQNDEDADLAKE